MNHILDYITKNPSFKFKLLRILSEDIKTKKDIQIVYPFFCDKKCFYYRKELNLIFRFR